MNRFPSTHADMNNKRDLFSNQNSNKYATQTEDYMEKQNDDRISHLGAQISQLKDITIQINQQVNDSNRYLDGMEKDFDKTGGMLGRTQKKLTNL